MDSALGHGLEKPDESFYFRDSRSNYVHFVGSPEILWPSFHYLFVKSRELIRPGPGDFPICNAQGLDDSTDSCEDLWVITI